jgi:cytochrome c oxidase cbb3-type subunit 3
MKPFHKIFSFLILVSLPSLALAKEAETTAVVPTGLEFNILLASVNGLLAIIMWMLLRVLLKSVKRESRKKNNSNAIKASAWFLVGMSSFSTLFAQTDPTSVAAPVNPALMYNDVIRWTLLTVAVIQLVVIYALIDGIDRIANPVSEEEKESESAFMKWWAKINNFKPIEQEASLDTGHNYDGIRELNNITPPWFTTAFVISIIFSVIYLYRYHVARTAPLQEQEFVMEMKEADAKLEEYLKKQANNVDENSVKMLGNEDIQKGAAIYASNCVACHGAKGEGLVGPNLTDEYWIYGGDVKGIFKTIKYGTENGMKSWKDDLSAAQIAQVASYVKSLAGTNPPNPKAPQGKVYQENTTPPTDSAVADSTKAPK